MINLRDAFPRKTLKKEDSQKSTLIFERIKTENKKMKSKLHSEETKIKTVNILIFYEKIFS